MRWRLKSREQVDAELAVYNAAIEEHGSYDKAAAALGIANRKAFERLYSDTPGGATARAILAEAGALVDPTSERVRFPRALVESKIGLAPETFTLHARNPENNLEIGGNAIAFCSVASAPNAADRDGGRRPGNRVDYQNLLKLGQSLDAVHLWGGYPVEPADIHASIRHLDALFDMLTLSDKAIHAYSLGTERNLDAIELVRIARGIDHATLEREPSVFTIIKLDNKVNVYQYQDSKGVMKEATDYRVTQGLSHFIVK